VPTVCFYEQHVTDYGSKAGGLFTWKEMVCTIQILLGCLRLTVLAQVVDERSACLDCSKALPLPKDHLKLNKYSGRDDSSFHLVCGQIHRMANLVANLSLYPDHQKWLASLQQSNPLDGLSAINRAKERTPDTCTWLLSQKEYETWFESEASGLLRIEGGPGTGKTVLAAFLVDELESATRKTPDMAFAYFFCDNKDENRKSATPILPALFHNC